MSTDQSPLGLDEIIWLVVISFTKTKSNGLKSPRNNTWNPWFHHCLSSMQNTIEYLQGCPSKSKTLYRLARIRLLVAERIWTKPPLSDQRNKQRHHRRTNRDTMGYLKSCQSRPCPKLRNGSPGPPMLIRRRTSDSSPQHDIFSSRSHASCPSSEITRSLRMMWIWPEAEGSMRSILMLRQHVQDLTISIYLGYPIYLLIYLHPNLNL